VWRVQAIILCGGRGTRAYPMTAELPKPLLQVGGQPILRHIMDLYAAGGVEEFVLAAGYRADVIQGFARGLPRGWKVTVVDTGDDTGTGGRITGCLDLLGETFFATYGDGIGDVDLEQLLGAHRRHGGATVTAVPLPSQYGTLQLDGDRVTGFVEKPRLRDHWVNAGFFVFDHDAFAQHAADDLERGALPALAAAGLLHVYRHEGFWKSLDTYKDQRDLDTLFVEGKLTWRS
jgi:glucose-1-phosphate cytidylyltransferase